MVMVEFGSGLKKLVKKIKNAALKQKVKKQIAKIVRNPTIGKPMRFTWKGTREVYVKPFRLSYLCLKGKNVIVFLSLYHKDEQ